MYFRGKDAMAIELKLATFPRSYPTMTRFLLDNGKMYRGMRSWTTKANLAQDRYSIRWPLLAVARNPHLTTLCYDLFFNWNVIKIYTTKWLLHVFWWYDPILHSKRGSSNCILIIGRYWWVHHRLRRWWCLDLRQESRCRWLDHVRSTP